MSLDSFPVAVCDNIRIPQAQIYNTEDYRGYIASKRRYFFGLKIPLLVTGSGEPVEVFLAYLQAQGRKIVETAGSLINRLIPKSIHAVTSRGFELKVMLFVLAYSVSCAV